MKRFLLLASLLLVLLPSNIFGQLTKYDWLHQESWSFGFGFTYPRYVSTNLRGGDYENYGMFVSIQRNISEHIGFRFQGNYMHLSDKQRANLGNQNMNTSEPLVENSIILGSFGLLYYFSPCEPVSPYAGFGAGGVDYKLKNSPIVVTATSSQSRPLDKNQIDYELNVFLGAEWTIGTNWKLKTELAYHTAASSKFDGIYGTETGGLLGGIGDTYMSFELGAICYFNYGEKSHICEIYDGINAKVDYNKIEEIVKRYQIQPTETEVDYNRIENIVKKYKCIGPPAVPVPKENWVLVGVNFDFNKTSLRPESVPVLDHTVEILLKNPEVKVEIQGHTDNIGSDKHNQKLSLQRAEAVRNFLITKGVAPNRLTAVGFGENRPITDNNSEQGRALNRRIELKIIK
jgi:OmpA-OmpF porin, OOP family